MIKTFCYISNINTSKKDIINLSKIVMLKNDIYNITGILIIQNGHFFQIIEGEQTITENTFKKIEADKRHSGLIKLLETKTDSRIFEAYESGHFSIIKDTSKLKKLKAYFDWVKEANVLLVNELIILTNNFIKYNI